MINNLGEPTFIGPSDSTSYASTPRASAAPTIEDQVQISTVPFTAQVEQLQKTNPSSFKEVVGDAIRSLRAEASQSTDPLDAAYLLGLADRFQRLQESGGAASSSAAAQAASS